MMINGMNKMKRDSDEWNENSLAGLELASFHMCHMIVNKMKSDDKWMMING